MDAGSSANGLNYIPYTSKRHSRTMSGVSDGVNSDTATEPSISDEVGPSTSRSSLPTSVTQATELPGPPMPEKRTVPLKSRSTFRRIGMRNSQPPTPSPLRPITMSTSTSFRTLTAASARGSRNENSIPGSPSGPNASLPVSAIDSSPKLNGGEHFNSPATPSSPKPSPSVSPSPKPLDAPLPPTPPSPLPLVMPPDTNASSSQPSTSQTAEPKVTRVAAPYRPGFQPKGVYRHRTEEFCALRDSGTGQRKSEERRIERRLEKMIDLHFPPETHSTPRLAESRRTSSIFTELKGKTPGDLLRNAMEAKPGSPAALRNAEQVITPWQDDSSAKACPICQSSFQPLLNRKHHCRLCGRVVCSLPTQKPKRPRPCSLLVAFDHQLGQVIPVPETIAYGVTKRPVHQRSGSVVDTDKDMQPKGFRVCRDCNVIIDRKQFLQESLRPTTFTKLHGRLIRIETEMETLLAELDALLPSMPLSVENPDAAALRKQFSVLFTDYDTVAKRIRGLSCPPDGSQHRMQQAVWMRAVNFMQLHMNVLKRMPKPLPTNAAAPRLPQILRRLRYSRIRFSHMCYNHSLSRKLCSNPSWSKRLPNENSKMSNH
ncbi:FYVE zinc finger-domain-containing protein [Cantharellus anzutake]|uniref:FYVE zinc finger-domain-containing protein n=1 Tax=Cantharellus anzutake TaxID=1750568 RepID=UPI0019058C5B|nr:FYVE zinc finger-domain-containing protein [Cantharellus anzutake]KAF8328881.1 FYVE zinc finger-domain-containing protein [Cantharellus anzutake]